MLKFAGFPLAIILLTFGSKKFVYFYSDPELPWNLYSCIDSLLIKKKYRISHNWFHVLSCSGFDQKLESTEWGKKEMSHTTWNMIKYFVFLSSILLFLNGMILQDKYRGVAGVICWVHCTWRTHHQTLCKLHNFILSCINVWHRPFMIIVFSVIWHATGFTAEKIVQHAEIPKIGGIPVIWAWLAWREYTTVVQCKDCLC